MAQTVTKLYAGVVIFFGGLFIEERFSLNELSTKVPSL